MGKNSCNVLVYLIQIYFFSKYLIKFEKFNNKSYIIFGLLAAIAWESIIGLHSFLSMQYFISIIENLNSKN